MLLQCSIAAFPNPPHACLSRAQDPVRAEVPDAVAVCKRAGITVRMVTGDNTYTAQHIARECGILTDQGIALEGPDFRNRSDEELMEILPSVQVGSRLQNSGLPTACGG